MLHLPANVVSEPNLSYRMLRAIYPVFRMLFPNQVIPADELGRAMVDFAVRGRAEREARIFGYRTLNRKNATNSRAPLNRPGD
jgi:hypothetical protein